jgi:hypothetical protein
MFVDEPLFEETGLNGSDDMDADKLLFIPSMIIYKLILASRGNFFKYYFEIISDKISNAKYK